MKAYPGAGKVWKKLSNRFIGVAGAAWLGTARPGGDWQGAAGKVVIGQGRPSIGAEASADITFARDQES